jgi:hypothetical protein
MINDCIRDAHYWRRLLLEMSRHCNLLVPSIINLSNCVLNDQISKNNTEWDPYNTKQRGQFLHPDWDASPITHLLFGISKAAYDMAVICPENSINYIIRSAWSTCVKSIIYDWIVAFFSLHRTWENSSSLEPVREISIIDISRTLMPLGIFWQMLQLLLNR